jgi:hypothetical protein
MTAPKIEIFNGSANLKAIDILGRAINEIGKYVPGARGRLNPMGADFINVLKQRTGLDNGMYDAERMMDLAFTREVFSPKTQKIILLDNLISQQGRNVKGMAGGRDDERQAAIISTDNLGPSQFYAVCLHEMGHMYGATARDNQITINNGRHCVDEECVMHVPGFNQRTKYKMENNSDMYCRPCQDGLRSL